MEDWSNEDLARLRRFVARGDSGDHVAVHIARERQENGSLMPGKIVRVYRDQKIL